MAAAAGVRRADSAISRFQAFTNDADALVDVRTTEVSPLSPDQSTAALLWQAFVLPSMGAAWAWVPARATAVIFALALAAGPALRLAGERPGEILRTE